MRGRRVALVAFFFPFYVKTKPMGVYAFSPVEVFVLVTAVATALYYAGRLRRELAARFQDKRDVPSLLRRWRALREQLRAADYAAAFFVLVATASLLFTERLDVATVAYGHRRTGALLRAT